MFVFCYFTSMNQCRECLAYGLFDDLGAKSHLIHTHDIYLLSAGLSEIPAVGRLSRQFLSRAYKLYSNGLFLENLVCAWP